MIGALRARTAEQVAAVVGVVVVVALVVTALEVALLPGVRGALHRASPRFDVDVSDLELSPFAGAVTLEGVRVTDRASGVVVVRARAVRVSVDGVALVDRAVAFDVDVNDAVVFVDDARVAKDLVADVVRAPVRRVSLDGAARVSVFDVDVTLVDATVVADDLDCGAVGHVVDRCAHVVVEGAVAGVGHVRGVVDVDPGAARPSFALSASVRGLPLDLGVVDAALRVDARDGRLRGVVLPVVDGAPFALSKGAAVGVRDVVDAAAGALR